MKMGEGRISYLERPRTADNRVIGLPMTPSEWLGKPRRRTVVRLKMTCGGGMGGCSWDEFVEDMPLEGLRDRTRLVTEDIDGKEILLNLDYLVKAERLDILERDMVTSNPNYFKGSTKVTVRELCGLGLEVEWSDEFEGRRD